MVERLELIRLAKQLAIEQIDGVAACNDAEYEELKEKDKEIAVGELALGFLKSAIDETDNYLDTIR